ncbi:MAG: fumarylacetoacetate hydrolase family protein [Gammaproteobacteria bacterium]
MKSNDIQACGAELFAALRGRRVVEPLTTRYPGITVENAYGISVELLNARMRDGEKLVGKKIGVTSKPVQRMLEVYQPDFGYLTDAMLVPAGEAVPISTQLIQPRAEAEIAFVMGRDLQGPGVTTAQVLAAVDFVLPCFEIVDSRIRDWKIRIEDTVADNASCGLVVLGTQAVDARSIDLAAVGCVVEKNGEVLSTGAGAAALGSPINSLVWLANTLGRFGVSLRAGEIVLSGSLVPLEPVTAGDVMRASIDRIGSLTARFV